MYQFLLTRRYLTSKLMPLLAALAVTLCCAMVLITWSVMGGFLTMLLSSGRSMVGDVVISWPNVGFPHYEELVEDLEAHPDVEAAVPMIETFGMMSLPSDRLVGTVIRGVEGPRFARVTEFEPAIWWRPMTEPAPKDVNREDWRLDTHEYWDQRYLDGLHLSEGTSPEALGPHAGGTPAVVLGIEVSGFNIRTPEGIYFPGRLPKPTFSGEQQMVSEFLPDSRVTLNVFPVNRQGRMVETVSRVLPVANEFQSGLYEVDSRTVLVRFDELQRMLRLSRAQRVEGEFNPFDLGAGPRTVVDPERTTHVLIRLRDGLDADEMKRVLRDEVYAPFAARHTGADGGAAVPSVEVINVDSWVDLNRTLIDAVRNETGLVLFVFSFISLTAVFLVLAIFWAMVSEKTKDVGVLRAVGASRGGVAAIWVTYGAGLGLVGSVAGVALAYAIVTNINAIHTWLGETFGLVIWDPSVYYFTEIPRQVEPDKAAFVFVGGVLASTIGALVPAWRAARMDPVRALRFE